MKDIPGNALTPSSHCRMPEKGGKLQLFQILWDGIGGLGIGTVILKGLFIVVLCAAFWVFCELLKYIVNIFSKLAVEAMRYLAVLVRGWPKNAEEEKDRQEKLWSSDKKGVR
jgi:hypothetical protein